MARNHKTMAELVAMEPKMVGLYEFRVLGFIAPVFDAITHSDNLREKTSADCLPYWKATWTFDNKRQRDYFRMIAQHRGYVCCEMDSAGFGPRLETRLQ